MKESAGHNQLASNDIPVDSGDMDVFVLNTWLIFCSLMIDSGINLKFPH